MFMEYGCLANTKYLFLKSYQHRVFLRAAQIPSKVYHHGSLFPGLM